MPTPVSRRTAGVGSLSKVERKCLDNARAKDAFLC